MGQITSPGLASYFAVLSTWTLEPCGVLSIRCRSPSRCRRETFLRQPQNVLVWYRVATQKKRHAAPVSVVNLRVRGDLNLYRDGEEDYRDRDRRRTLRCGTHRSETRGKGLVPAVNPKKSYSADSIKARRI